MKIPSPRPNRRARIEIIPLIDIIFFLLATFVMVSLSMVKNQGIQLNLPQAVTGGPQETTDQEIVSVDSEGRLFLKKEPVQIDDLRRRFQQLKTTAPDTRIHLQGDDKAYFGRVLAVLDLAREIGLTKIIIQTRSPQK